MRRSLRALLLAVSALILGVTTTILSPLPAWATVTRLCYGYTSCANAGMGSDGYAQRNSTMYWRMYPGHNCTNYAAYRMIRSGLPNERPWSGSGNATYWGTSMPGITDQTPKVGAVAWWRAGVYPAGSAGHVAYVEQVISPTEIIVSQDSWGGDFSWARISKSGSGWPSGFVHFNDIELKNLTRPTVTGTPKVGGTLAATPGTWSPGSPTATYEWLIDGETLRGATSSQLTLTDDMVGKHVRVKVTARKDGYPAKSRTSLRTAPVLPGELSTTAAPTVTGTPEVGQTLTGSPGAWTPTPDEIRYRWMVDGVRAADGTASTYTVTSDDVGKDIALKVVALRSGFKKVAVTTAPQQVRPGTLVPSGDPTVSGSRTPGESLRATLPTVSPTADRTVQWLRDGEPIPGADTRRYTLTGQDLGHRVRAQVQWAKDGYTPLALLSPIPARVRVTPDLTADFEQTGRRVLVSVRVAAPGLDQVLSTVAVRDERNRVVAEKTLRADGTATLRLTDQAAGKHTYRVATRKSEATRWAYVERTFTVR